MKEVKQPSKKPLVYYYLVALLILMVLNLTLFPAMLETPVQDVTYDQFMSMTYEQNVGQVQIEGDEITFTDKTNEKVYRTTATNDPDRTQRLYENGAQFHPGGLGPAPAPLPAHRLVHQQTDEKIHGRRRHDVRHGRRL